MKILFQWVIYFQLLLAPNLLFLSDIADVEFVLRLANLNTGVIALAFDSNEKAALGKGELELPAFSTVILKYLNQ